MSGDLAVLFKRNILIGICQSVVNLKRIKLFVCALLHFSSNLFFSKFSKRVWFISCIQNYYSNYGILLIGFSKLTRDNSSVSMATQSIVVERILFNSSTKQIEISLFSFLLISDSDVFPVDSFNFTICQNLWASTVPEILGYVDLVNSLLYCVVCAFY